MITGWMPFQSIADLQDLENNALLFLSALAVGVYLLLHLNFFFAYSLEKNNMQHKQAPFTMSPRQKKIAYAHPVLRAKKDGQKNLIMKQFT